jgi:hypothetical protein
MRGDVSWVPHPFGVWFIKGWGVDFVDSVFQHDFRGLAPKMLHSYPFSGANSNRYPAIPQYPDHLNSHSDSTRVQLRGTLRYALANRPSTNLVVAPVVFSALRSPWSRR